MEKVKLEKVSGAELIKRMADKSDFSQKDIKSLLDLLQSEIITIHEEGKRLAMVGFMSTDVTEREARKGINPKTKEEIDIDASKTITVKFAKEMKNCLNK